MWVALMKLGLHAEGPVPRYLCKYLSNWFMLQGHTTEQDSEDPFSLVWRSHFFHKPQEFSSILSTSPGSSYPQGLSGFKVKRSQTKNPPVCFLFWTWIETCPEAINQRTGLPSLMRERKGKKTGWKKTSFNTLKYVTALVIALKEEGRNSRI